MREQRPCIVVIDDSREYLDFMETLLTAEGYRVKVAHSLDTARALLAAANPDLIITDVRMPGLPPFSVLDLLDADARLRAVPVLLCTGATQEVDQAVGRLAHPAREVLFKPFDLDDLLARIARLVRTHGPSPP
jgi:putative two-component system response regulator